MFGSLGIPELLLIFAVALIVFGPKRLPEIGRTLGKAMGEFKKATDDFKNTIEREVQVEELKQLASTTIVPVHESISRTAPVEPTANGIPAEPPKLVADLTPEAATKHDA
jgi:TatA/E family protein of Tat protein translocase